MKYLVVLLFLVSVVYAHQEHPNTTIIPGFYFDGIEVTEAFDISRLGTDLDKTLECRTDLDSCCGMTQGFHRGDWYFPNHRRLDLSCGSDSLYQSRHDKSVRLHRRGDNYEEGHYCCIVETIQQHRENYNDTFDFTFDYKKFCIKLVNGTDCPPLEQPANGEFDLTDGYSHGSTAIYSCDKRYRLIGDYSYFKCYAGEWEHDPPMCEGYCRKPDLFNGTVDVTGDSAGSNISFTCDDGFEAVGPTKGTCQSNFTWNIRPYCRGCADKLYVMAFTSTQAGGGSDYHHSLYFSLKDGTNKTISFPDRVGDDMESNKGDLWTFDLRDEGFPCFGYHDVDKIAIVATSNDNWHIESISTALRLNTRRGFYYPTLTIDMEANRWVDKYRDDGQWQRFNLSRFRAPYRGCRPGFDMFGRM